MLPAPSLQVGAERAKPVKRSWVIRSKFSANGVRSGSRGWARINWLFSWSYPPIRKRDSARPAPDSGAPQRKGVSGAGEEDPAAVTAAASAATGTAGRGGEIAGGAGVA